MRSDKKIFSGLLILITLIVASSGCMSGRQSTHNSNLWSSLKGYGLGSVAWSPKGDKIAFVAARWKDVTDTTDPSPDRNSIWILSLSKSFQPIGIRRLVILERKANGEGLAAVPFWLDNERIGWATHDGQSFTFMQMGLRDKKPKRLVNQNFSGVPVSDFMWGSAPGDVYYDADSRTLLFSGDLVPTGVYVRLLPLSTKKVRNLAVPYPKGLIGSEISLDAISICGSVENPKKPLFYVTASAISDVYGESGSYLWQSNSYSLKQDKIITKGGAMFPRTSPDGKSLACLEGGKLALYDLESGKHKVLVKLFGADSPAAGWCPYSWSPDGKKIAYSDGARIKFVDVPSAL